MSRSGESNGSGAGEAAGHRLPSARDRAALAAFQLGTGHLQAGELEAAMVAFRECLRLRPGAPEPLNNLGIALKHSGQPREALAAWREALETAPGYAAAHGNLAALLAATGETAAALRHYVEAMRLEPANPAHRDGFVRTLRPLRFTEAGAAVRAALLTCLADPGIEHQPLVPAALSLLKLESPLRAAIGLAFDADDRDLADWFIGPGGEALRHDALLLAILRRAVLADPGFERLWTRLRDLLLHAEPGSSLAGLLDRDPAFFAALACQAFLTDYAWAEPDGLEGRLAELAAAQPVRSGDKPGLSREALLFALFRPLAEHPRAEALAARRAGARREGGPDWAGPLIELTLRRPLAEKALEPRLAVLTPVAGAVSTAVRRQYEENPHPRWSAVPRAHPRPLAQALAAILPEPLDHPPHPQGPLQVLVAGCGTGRLACEAATAYLDCEVLALDLSRRALAFGARQARDLGIANVTFAQGDILALGNLRRRFHLVEAVGVLHHLADPLEGWRRLLDRLEPEGLLCLGLPSRAARRHLVAAAHWLSGEGYGTGPEDIRAARQALLALPADAEHAEIRRVVEEPDFYSLAGCRSLLFNARESLFDLDWIAACLDNLGLEFLGFEFAGPEIPERFRETEPAAGAERDLAAWAAFEAAEPAAFGAGYRFWCRPAG